MPYFYNRDKFGFSNSSSGLEDFEAATREFAHEVDRIRSADLGTTNRRMEAGKAMFRYGLALGVAPIPGNIDEVVGSAMILAGAATMISESLK